MLCKPFCGVHMSVPQCFSSSKGFPLGRVGSLATRKDRYKVFNGSTENALGRG